MVGGTGRARGGGGKNSSATEPLLASFLPIILPAPSTPGGCEIVLIYQISATASPQIGGIEAGLVHRVSPPPPTFWEEIVWTLH